MQDHEYLDSQGLLGSPSKPASYIMHDCGENHGEFSFSPEKKQEMV